MNRRLWLLPALCVVAALWWWQNHTEPAPAPGVPAATWRIGLGTEVRQGRNYDGLADETPVRLSYRCDEPRIVYVFSRSDTDGTLLLFPSPQLDASLKNPLPAGPSVLPGRHAEQELAWTTRTGVVGPTTYVAIAAREPLPELEALLAKLRQWSNTVFPDRRLVVSNPRPDTGVVGLPTDRHWPAAVLQRAADAFVTEVQPNGPMRADPQTPGVWLAAWRVVPERSSRPAQPQPK